ncbi:MAG: orotate phosphoribosyltransferase [Candidatus Infernicultor aquiphilus]|uniref:Orotate phosphoribosyltransferase n=1 Tax=Candidatus Infernicultor aquiphilus TaxID=1805029 RepID=A0A1J5GJZ4_9BACT|nr:MAG: orotate phosphoribosyltransferase [Candidatus Atribacteria bacterium CG2_30_33_13]PIU25879.1 MAG: orotate phosphoribosyltransferase [Candidatus Atribacteria bacterium CG08_land_8_20_14_0_20_33_29]PIW12475.1 MAG: orotate phosphoribosyltransferase [Candidatus Atribacteria bacterium CG17_big_fil_post_rev_8_21_14_2_50_34_11]PIX34956.1 MAG: orotate phosphoribosyltransferase [Candidatus Atribacteria bacterium CG_4_8_14_3_um_filter_34_18]PIY31844.1 MAG: orotate phosphoribosyltransferase [Candi
MIINTEEVMRKFEEAGAIQKGHFKLTSGVHSDIYIQCAQVMQYPEFMNNLCSELGKKFRGEDVDVIVGPAVGAIIMAHVMARVLGPWVRAIFTERENGKMTLRRSFKIKKGEKVLVVEDVTTTGSSVREVIEIVKERQGKVVGVGALIDRSGGKIDFGVKTQSLLTLDIKTYLPEVCPLCKKGIPAIKPGSRDL